MTSRDSVLIRAATAEDVPQLATLAANTFRDTFGHLYEPHHLAKHLDKTCSIPFFQEAMAQRDTILLACDGQTVVGYIKLGKVALPVEAPLAEAIELHRLYLLPAYQGKGISHALMEMALQLPAIQRAPAIYLGVYEHNHRAQRFYAGYGFVAMGEYTYYVGPHADRELIMQRVSAAAA